MIRTAAHVAPPALPMLPNHALKDDKHRQGRDVLDIRSLLKYNPDRLPEGRLRELSERYAGPGIYESHIQPYL
jgi:hypothetical protein